MNKLCFFDIETTGFSRQWDSILEIAAVTIDDNTKQIDKTFHQYIKPYKSIPANITELTGITNSFVANKPSEMEVLREYLEWLCINDPTTFVGHNIKAFDIGFIREKSLKYNLQFNEKEIIDTLVLARGLNKCGKIITPNCKQPTIAEYFNIQYAAHSAIEDVKALIQIYYKMKELEIPSNNNLGF